MKIKLIRHGESVANANRELYYQYRDHMIPLSPKGIKQAMNCGNELGELLKKESVKNIFVYFSPYLRTVDTTKYLLENEKMKSFSVLVNESNPLLREQEYKDFKCAMDYQEKINEKKEFGEFFYRFKNAESMADTFQRVSIFVNYLMLIRNSIPKDTAIVIVAHEITIRCFNMIFNHVHYDDSKIDVHNCEILSHELNDLGRSQK